MKLEARRLAAARLASLQVAGAKASTPAEVVAALGAVQAQDYAGSLWAVGLRVPGATEADVERAVDERRIVRTWPMRGTLHFVAAPDVRWMLSLLAARFVRGDSSYSRQLGLDERAFTRARRVVTRALEREERLSRPELYARLEEGGIASAGQCGIYILCRLAMEGLVCCAGRIGRQTAFALLDRWVPDSRTLQREEALAEIARRFFSGHGPATLRDFAWWTGMNLGDARSALALGAADLARQEIDGVEHWMAPGALDVEPSPRVDLLAPFDEYLTSYRDRHRLAAPPHHGRIWAGGMFHPPVVVDGRITGTWKRSARAKAPTVTPTFFDAPPRGRARALAAAVRRYEAFLGSLTSPAARSAGPPCAGG